MIQKKTEQKISLTSVTCKVKLLKPTKKQKNIISPPFTKKSDILNFSIEKYRLCVSPVFAFLFQKNYPPETLRSKNLRAIY